MTVIDPLLVRHVAVSNVWTGAQTIGAKAVIGRNMLLFILDFEIIG